MNSRKDESEDGDYFRIFLTNYCVDDTYLIEFRLI